MLIEILWNFVETVSNMILLYWAADLKKGDSITLCELLSLLCENVPSLKYVH